MQKTGNGTNCGALTYEIGKEQHQQARLACRDHYRPSTSNGSLIRRLAHKAGTHGEQPTVSEHTPEGPTMEKRGLKGQRTFSAKPRHLV